MYVNKDLLQIILFKVEKDYIQMHQTWKPSIFKKLPWTLLEKNSIITTNNYPGNHGLVANWKHGWLKHDLPRSIVLSYCTFYCDFIYMFMSAISKVHQLSCK